MTARKAFFALVCALSVAAPAAADGDIAAALAEAPAFSESASAGEILAVCRSMVPSDVAVSGHVNRRSRHGTEIAAYTYALSRKNGAVSLEVKDKEGKTVFKKTGDSVASDKPAGVQEVERIAETDVTWSDLSMDFLWWDDVSFDEKAESESLAGIVCKVLLLKNGDRAFRAWIDRRTGALIQASELRDGKTVREIFCTSLKKFGDRWSPKNIEVGPPGAKYRTKIVVEDVR